MGRNVDNLRLRYADLTRQIERLRQEQDRLNRAAERHSRLTNMGSKAMMAGSAVGAAGAGLLLAARGPIDQAKAYQKQSSQIDAQGFSKKDAEHVKAAAIEQSKKILGTSIVAAMHTANELSSVFGDTHHAEMALPSALKQRNALRLYNETNSEQLSENAAYAMARVIELRNGTKDMAEYNKQANMAHQVMVATKGRVNGDEMAQALRTGGIAAKSMSDEAFYYGSSHLMQEMHGDVFGTALMSAYQNLAQGKITKRAALNMERFGLIGDMSKVTEDKAGQLKYLNPGALKGYETYVRDPQKWVNETLIPNMRQNGINPDDMTQVAEYVGQIITNRTAANLIATMVAQRGIIDKTTKNARRADNIDKGYDRYNQTASGKEDNLLAKKENLLFEIGDQSLPLYVKFLEMASGALQKLNGFMAQNPALASAIGNGLMALGAVFAVFGPLLIGGGGLIWGFGQFVMVGSRLMPLLSLLTGAAKGLGVALRFLALNPVGMVITAIGLLVFAGYQLYKHWDTWGPKLQQVGAMILDYLLKPINMSINAINGLTGLMNKIPGVKIDRLQTASQLLGVDKASRNAAEYNLPATIAKPAAAAPVAQSSTTNHFTINQQPGQDQRSLAREIAKQIERQNAVKSNSTMFDGVPAL